jgi:hypothetical protein
MPCVKIPMRMRFGGAACYSVESTGGCTQYIQVDCSFVKMADPSLSISVEGRGVFHDASSYLGAASTVMLSSNPSWQDHPLWETNEGVPGRLHEGRPA